MAEKQPKNDHGETSKPPSDTFEARRAEIVKFLLAVCELKGFDYNEKVTDTLLELWLQAVADIPVEVLGNAFEHTVRNLQSGTYWPTPGDIRALIGEAFKIPAEQAWRQVVKQLEQNHYDPSQGWLFEWTANEKRAKSHPHAIRRDEWDRGWYLLPPPLSPQAEYAVEAVGGWDRIRRDVGSKQHDFVRREFVGQFITSSKNPELLIGDNERRQIGPQSSAMGSRSDAIAKRGV